MIWLVLGQLITSSAASCVTLRSHSRFTIQGSSRKKAEALSAAGAGAGAGTPPLHLPIWHMHRGLQHGFGLLPTIKIRVQKLIYLSFHPPFPIPSIYLSSSPSFGKSRLEKWISEGPLRVFFVSLCSRECNKTSVFSSRFTRSTHTKPWEGGSICRCTLAVMAFLNTLSDMFAISLTLIGHLAHVACTIWHGICSNPPGGQPRSTRGARSYE